MHARTRAHNGVCWNVSGWLTLALLSVLESLCYLKGPMPLAQEALPSSLTDHLLAADPTDAHNLHSLTSIVDSITVEDMSVAFPDETMPN